MHLHMQNGTECWCWKRGRLWSDRRTDWNGFSSNNACVQLPSESVDANTFAFTLIATKRIFVLYYKLDLILDLHKIISLVCFFSRYAPIRHSHIQRTIHLQLFYYPCTFTHTFMSVESLVFFLFSCLAHISHCSLPLNHYFSTLNSIVSSRGCVIVNILRLFTDYHLNT